MNAESDTPRLLKMKSVLHTEYQTCQVFTLKTTLFIRDLIKTLPNVIRLPRSALFYVTSRGNFTRKQKTGSLVSRAVAASDNAKVAPRLRNVRAVFAEWQADAHEAAPFVVSQVTGLEVGRESERAQSLIGRQSTTGSRCRLALRAVERPPVRHRHAVAAAARTGVDHHHLRFSGYHAKKTSFGHVARGSRGSSRHHRSGANPAAFPCKGHRQAPVPVRCSAETRCRSWGNK